MYSNTHKKRATSVCKRNVSIVDGRKERFREALRQVVSDMAERRFLYRTSMKALQTTCKKIYSDMGRLPLRDWF
jgi:hypothetical protein